MKKSAIAVVVVAALLAVAAGAVYSRSVKPVPPDNAQVSELKFDLLMGSRYAEILLVFGNALTGSYTAGVYNTVGLNGANPAGGGDSSPALILDKIDMRKVKEDNGALSTVKNGARLWTVDHIGVKSGRERDFQGLRARWVMWYPIPDELRKGGELSYQAMHAKRDTSMGTRKGSRAYILDDPQGAS